MAIAISIPYPSAGRAVRSAVERQPRHAYPRVYSPLGPRRLARPMAVPLAAADPGSVVPPGRQRPPLFRIRRG